MNSKPTIKLYGESHGSENLLEAYDEIFATAKKEGCKTCYFEREPFWLEGPQGTHALMKEISQYDPEKFQQSKVNIFKAYKDRFGPRGSSAGVYVAYLAVEAGIRLVHADVASHPLRMVLIQEAISLSPTSGFQAVRDFFINAKLAMASDAGWDRANVAQMVGRVGWDTVNLKRLFQEIESELNDEYAFTAKCVEDRKRRFSEDVFVAEYILSRLDDHPAIVIYGKSHIDYERPDSIASVLAGDDRIRTQAFHIVDGKIVPRPGEIKKVGSEIWPLDTMEKEYPKIQNDRGMVFRKGQGVEADSTEARWWFAAAAKQGFAEAQYNLADLYFDNFSHLTDYAKAFYWASKAAEQRNVQAWALLGNMYYRGRGVPKDDEKSAEFYEKAAMAGDTFSQSMTGYNYHKGQGVKKDLVLAYMWYFIAAKRDDKHAIKNLVLARKKLSPSQIAQAKEMAQKWSSETCGPRGSE